MSAGHFVSTLRICTAPVGGLSLLNEAGGLRVFFPRNSFVTNTTLTHTNTPRGGNYAIVIGNDHIVCYGGDTMAEQVTWHNSSGQLVVCQDHPGPVPCIFCGGRCRNNGGVGVDPPLNGHTDIHMYTDSPSYVNQDLECRVSSGQSAFIGVNLGNGGQLVMSLSNLAVQIIQHMDPVPVTLDNINYSTVIMINNIPCNVSLPPSDARAQLPKV